jgi:hypothetical protein
MLRLCERQVREEVSFGRVQLLPSRCLPDFTGSYALSSMTSQNRSNNRSNNIIFCDDQKSPAGHNGAYVKSQLLRRLRSGGSRFEANPGKKLGRPPSLQTSWCGGACLDPSYIRRVMI